MKNLLSVLLFIGFLSANAQVSIKDLTCEHQKDPLSIDARNPRFSWKLAGSERNILQKAYQIKVFTNADMKIVFWDSGKINSDESVLQEYKGNPLQSATRYYWQVKVWDAQGKEATSTEPASFEMGLLYSGEWKAKWIDPEGNIDPKKQQPAPLIRKDFKLAKKVASARLYVTSRGLNEMYINGKRVGDYVFTPGWTAYKTYFQYFTYDITPLLRTGNNTVGAMLGDGWYRGFLAWASVRNHYGERLALLAQVVVRFTDGSQQIVGTDETWRTTSKSPVVNSDLYMGETYDARAEQGGWADPSFNDAEWKPAIVKEYPLSNLVAPKGPPVRRIEELKAVKLITTPEGDKVIDFGQNLTGWVKMKVRGSAGTTVKLEHAEVLDKKGNFYIENLRAAKCEINYTLKGLGEEVYEPHFTFFGFRYLRVKNYPIANPDGIGTTLTLDDFTAVVVHSDMPKTGEFTCSNPLINQLQHNIQWGQKGNFLDVPTDCPQRDERLGWTGDAQAFARTAAYNYDVSGFFSKWLTDVAADQQKTGAVPFVIPDVLSRGGPQVSAGWGDVAVIAPWTMYTVYGDKRLLETQYPSMKAYVEYIRKTAGDSLIWKKGSVFGDWLFYHPRETKHSEADGFTNHDYIATAFYAYSTHLLQQAAEALGKKEDASFYKNLFSKIKENFIQEYFTARGRTASDSQTSYVLALFFDLMPQNLRPKAVEYLVNDIKGRGNHLSTGFLGTPYLCHVLSQNGKTDVAYDLLFQETYPSWLYPVKMGATTIWERWDGIKTDSTFQDAGMNSFNHYAYGAIGDWMYRTTAGLEAGKAGYKHILIQPQPTTKLDNAKATFNSSYGEIESGWTKTATGHSFSIKIPANTTATVKLPVSDLSKVTEKGETLKGYSTKVENNQVVIEVGSGAYVFDILK
jgi:alpha-L-rhamnosidase